ncbi:hypothetical protein SUGI_0205820 [Cryptomeria japonica]|nr:hypothetical protein SUGI_0205820 [Cryptomeria japonica]
MSQQEVFSAIVDAWNSQQEVIRRMQVMLDAMYLRIRRIEERIRDLSDEQRNKPKDYPEEGKGNSGSPSRRKRERQESPSVRIRDASDGNKAQEETD